MFFSLLSVDEFANHSLLFYTFINWNLNELA